MTSDNQEMEATAKRIRRTILDMIHRTKSPHIGSSFSSIEILVALFNNELNLSNNKLDDPERDRFIMSKGHACAALYATLAEFNFFDKEDLGQFAIDDGIFERHSNIDLKRGIEVSAGSLGHGLSIGTGMALAARMDRRLYKTCVLMSDGELNEGSVWEAVMFAGHHKLSNLVALVDANRIQALGFTKDIIDLEPLVDKWSAFGWHAKEVDGHSFQEIRTAFSDLSEERPNVLVLHTVKGKGVSFMENNLLWHYRAPDDEEYKKALQELSE